MNKLYRAKLVGKNQMTIPVQLQKDLDMNRGDELEFVIERGRIIDVRVLKPIPVNLLPDEVLTSLKEHRRTCAREPVSLEELRRDLEVIDTITAAKPIK